MYIVHTSIEMYMYPKNNSKQHTNTNETLNLLHDRHIKRSFLISEISPPPLTTAVTIIVISKPSSSRVMLELNTSVLCASKTRMTLVAKPVLEGNLMPKNAVLPDTVMLMEDVLRVCSEEYWAFNCPAFRASSSFIVCSNSCMYEIVPSMTDVLVAWTGREQKCHLNFHGEA